MAHNQTVRVIRVPKSDGVRSCDLEREVEIVR